MNFTGKIDCFADFFLTLSTDNVMNVTESDSLMMMEMLINLMSTVMMA